MFSPGHLEDDVYMEQPPKFVTQGEYSGCGIVCQLHQSLYGFKQTTQT